MAQGGIQEGRGREICNELGWKLSLDTQEANTAPAQQRGQSTSWGKVWGRCCRSLDEAASALGMQMAV